MAERNHWQGVDGLEVEQRLAIGALFTPGSALRAQPGVFGTGLGVTQTGSASTSVVVAAGRCVNQSSSSIGGAYFEQSDSTKTIDVIGAGGLAPGSSPRRDLIVYESGLPVGQRIHRVEGTPAASPVDPAVPAQSVVLARVRVKTATQYGGSVVVVNADIDDLRTYTTLNIPTVPTPGVVSPNSPFAAAAVGGFEGVAVERDATGYVRWRGELTGSGGGVPDQLIATVPAGFRPAAARTVLLPTRSGGSFPSVPAYVNASGELRVLNTTWNNTITVGLSMIGYPAA